MKNEKAKSIRWERGLFFLDWCVMLKILNGRISEKLSLNVRKRVLDENHRNKMMGNGDLRLKPPSSEKIRKNGAGRFQP